MLFSVAYWTGDCAVLHPAFHATPDSAPTGVSCSPQAGQFGTPSTPGDVGGMDSIVLGVLTASGVSLGLGAAAIILYRFVFLGIQAAAGATAVATLPPRSNAHPSRGTKSVDQSRLL